MPETWIATLASGRSMAKLATLLTTSRFNSPRRKAIVELLALGGVGAPGEQRRVQLVGQLFQLVEILADDEHLILGVLARQLVHDLRLDGILRRHAILLALLG